MNRRKKREFGHTAVRTYPFVSRLASVVLIFAFLITMFQMPVVQAEGDFTANIEMDAKIVKDTGSGSQEALTSVESGDSFFLQLNYKFSSSTAGVSYEKTLLSLTLPPYVEVDLEQSVVTGDFKKPTLVPVPVGGTTYYSVRINGQDVIEQGSSGVLYLKFHFKNMETPNNTTATFGDIILTGTMVKDTETDGIDVVVDPVSIQSKAAQSWDISKTVVDPNPAGSDAPVVTRQGDYYYVTYQVAVTDPLGNSNRYGRLNCDPFTVTDVLPVADREGGGAQLVSVGYLDRAGEQVLPLAEGDDGYTASYHNDGSLKEISFHYFNHFDSDSDLESGQQAMIPDGALLPTTYQVRVKYSADAYSFPTNIPLVREVLKNEAVLNYTPLGEAAVFKKSDASVRVGDTEEKTSPVSLKVQKQLTVDGDASLGIPSSFILDQEKQGLYGTARFALYMDQDCTVLARDIDGIAGAGNERALDENGMVSFNNLRYGTYYLKETVAPDGFLASGTDGVTKVTILKDGTVQIGNHTTAPGSAVIINNTTDENGVGYVVFWKKGISAAGTDQTALAGVTFTLVLKQDPNQTYTAISNQDGVVVFEGIPAGSYTLTETASSDENEYSVLSNSWDVQVKGNQINYLGGTKDSAVVINESPKGKLEVIKEDSGNSKLKLSDAEFEIYGPYQQQTDVIPDGALAVDTITTGEDGKALSAPLEPGWYLLKETIAPTGYAPNAALIPVQVQKQSVASVTVPNDQRGTLEILKYGQLSVGSVVTDTTIALAGAEFTVYSDENCTEIAKDAAGNPAVVVTRANPVTGKPATPKITLNPGNYWVKETKTPEGYQADTTVYPVTVVKGQNTAQEVFNTVSQKGQIKIQKVSDRDSSGDFSGVIFDVYRADDTSFQTVIDTVTTDQDGIGYSKFLDSGNYVLKERSGLSGHIVPDGAFNAVENGIAVMKANGSGIAVQDNTLVSFRVKNEPYVSIHLKKVDSKTNAVLKGAQFALYATLDDAQNKKNAIATVTTGDDGVAVFSNLVPGTNYWYRELSAPTGYEASDSPILIVSPSKADQNYADKTVSVTNDRYGIFKIYKEGEKLNETGTKIPLSSVIFSYYPKLTDDAQQDLNTATANQTLKQTKATGTDGYTVSDPVVPGEYWVVEQNTQDGYALDTAPKTVTVSAGSGMGSGYPNSEVLTVTNALDKGKVQLKKISSLKENGSTDIPLNAKFEIYENNSGNKGNLVDTITTNAQGIATSKYLEEGDYLLIEISAKGIGNDSSVYDVDSTPIPFEITAGEINTTFLAGSNVIENQPKRRIGIDKFEKWLYAGGSDPVFFRQTGITFDVYSDRDLTQKVATLSSSTATVYTGSLKPGTYWVVESGLPDEYEVESVKIGDAALSSLSNGSYEVTLTDAEDLVLTWTNQSDYGRLKLTKMDYENHSIKLDNANFELYRVVMPGESGYDTAVAVPGTTDRVMKVEKQGIMQSGTMYQADGVTKEKGSALSILLESGSTYYLKETAAPSGYQMIHEWNGPYTVSAGQITQADIYNIKPVTTDGKKVDQDGQAVRGAWVGLFTSLEDATAAQSKILTDSGYFKNIVTNSNKWDTEGIFEAVQSNSSGVLSFANVVPQTTYYALELVGVSGYTHNTEIYPVQAQSQNGGWKLYHYDTASGTIGTVFELPNEAYGRIELKKEITLSGVTYPLNDVKFNIYVADENDATIPAAGLDPVATAVTGTATTSGDGTFLSIALPPGNYVLQEDEASLPDTVVYDDTYRPVTVTAGETNRVYVINPVQNVAAYGQVAITKISSYTGDQTSGNPKKLQAVFKIQQKQLNGEYTDYPSVDSVMKITTDPSKDYMVSGLLPPGEYQLVELSVQTGYTKNTTPILFEIASNKITGIGNISAGGVYRPLDNNDTPQPIAIENDKQGGIELVKYGVLPGKTERIVLSDVTFELYRASDSGTAQEDCVADNLVKTGTTGTDGKLVLSNVDAGTYWLKEISVDKSGSTIHADQGFVAGLTVKVTVNEGETTTKVLNSNGDATEDLVNTTTYGQLQIVKEDANASDVKLENAVFGVYTDAQASQQVDTITTGSNGVAVTKLLPAGSYYLKEKTAPNGYFNNQTVYGPHEVFANAITSTTGGSGSAQEIVIPNSRQQTVQIVKKDSKTGQLIGSQAMAKSVFELYASDQTTLLQTVRNGAVVFTQLQPNTIYYIKEVTPPQGYTFAPDHKDGWYQVQTDNTGTKEIEIYNDPLGAIQIQKVARWENVTDPLPLKNVGFTLYHYDSSKAGNKGEVASAQIKTDHDGMITFSNLVPGDYVLEETDPPEGFTLDGTLPEKITVEKGQTNTVYTGTNAIVNWPTKGAFTLMKVKGDGSTPLTVEDGEKRAKFMLYRGKGIAGEELGTFELEKDGTFTSAAMDVGWYTIVEIEAPEGFAINPDPISFEIIARKIVDLGPVSDPALGNIQITKQGDSQNGNPKLNTAVFQLYHANTDEPIGEAVTNVTNGIYRWEGIEPGRYYVQETAAPEGYELDTTKYYVTVPGGKNTVETYYPTVTGNTSGIITNISDSGRIRVLKQDENQIGLSGAKFEIYTLVQDAEGEKVGEMTTGSDGYAVSGLLPADPSGTVYLVKEVKAPNGYTLDDRYYPTHQLVTVLPVQIESILSGLTGTNFASFTNKKTDDIRMFDGDILKTIGKDIADKSLLEEEFSTTFTLRDYAMGTNELPANELTVTDNQIEMQWSDGGIWTNETLREDAYRITSVTVYQAYNAVTEPALNLLHVDTEKPVRAVLQYQDSAHVGSSDPASWQDVPGAVIEHAELLGSDGKTFTIPDSLNAMAFRVRYTGVNVHFVAAGIDFGVTFAQRPSDATLHEITRIRNTAEFSYQFIQKTEDGTDDLITLGGVSNVVTALLPLVEESRVPVSLVIRPTDDTAVYTPDSDVNFQLTAKNESAQNDYVDPVVSFDLPYDTTLNEFVEGDQQFIVMLMRDVQGGSVGQTLIPEIIFSETDASVVEDGKPVPISGKTMKVTMKFPGLSLKPGERITVKFAAHINQDASANTLYCPAYIGSLYELPVSAENPYGVSYTPVNTGTGGSFQHDDSLDDVLNNGGSEYVNNNAEITLGQNNSLSISKQVKGMYDTRYKNSSEVGHTAPGGSIDYKIRMVNGTQATVGVSRVIDILPFYGDTFTDRTDSAIPSRVTDLERRPTLDPDSIVVRDKDGNLIDSNLITVYYCTDDVSKWTELERLKQSASAELPMLYQTGNDGQNPWEDSASIHSWTTDAPADFSKVTAIGVEVSKELAVGEYFELTFGMTAPLYATEEGEEFIGKYISNSAMCAVVRKNNGSDSISLNDRSENQEVRCMLEMPKGSIGDYAFYDDNHNGVQDAGENPVAGLRVQLHITRTTSDGIERAILETTTDSTGYYLFDNLDCNTLLAGKKENSENPDDYVGESIYQYQVEFDNPPDAGGFSYVPTRQYAVADSKIDSNIDQDGLSEILTLKTSINPTTNLIEAESNLTIDAGFVIPSSLGDRVWLDDNRNGIQDPNESGINGATVRLYAVSDDGTVKDQPLATTKTKNDPDVGDGYYCFEGLTEGKYIVEFDVTSLKNVDGRYEYAFTNPKQDVDGTADSDARDPVDSDERVMRTEVITLGRHQHDPDWDAGLVYYSALGGYAFEDRNYNNIQDLNIDLTGTKVSLYRVINGIREDQAYRTTMVDENGRYLFEYLIEGQYQVYFDFPDDYQAVLGNQGSDDELDSDVVLELSDDLNTGYTEVIDLPANSTQLHWDGGARLYGAIGDYVWEDSDKDGIQDQGEKPLEGITVYLQQRSRQADGSASIWRYHATTQTDENGRYLFSGLESGIDTPYEYRVIFELSESVTITIPNSGTNSAVDSDALDYMDGWGYWTQRIPLGYGETDLTWDAGIIHTSGSVGDYVWLDENRNGVQDEENTGIAGIPVVLEYNAGEPTSESGWTVIGQTVTGSTGYYRFDDLQEGYYRVRFQVSSPYTVTGSNRGDGTDAFRYDSDGTIRKNDNWYYSRPFYLEEEGFDMSWDCGVVLGGRSVVTGDFSNPYIIAAMAGIMIAALGLFLFFLFRKRKCRK